MNLKFNNKRITGILTVLPARVMKFEDNMANYNFSESKSLKLKQVMGYDRHRMFGEHVTTSDVGVFGLEYLFNQGLLDKNSVDALLLLTQSPDYFMPATSNVIQGRLDMKHDMICMDINQGCAAFEVGLITAFSLLEQENINKVVLLNADLLSKKVSKHDRNSFPLIGDAASVTIIEKDPAESVIYANIKMDGTRHDALMIPAGGFREPASPKTAELQDDNGNLRSRENLAMKGDAVFNFVQTEVPPMIEDLLTFSGIDKEAVDYYMFHQPNKFMLQKLADKLGIPHHKMPNNIVENFGNASGVTVPTAITFNIGDKLTGNSYYFCLAGFGVGLTWSSIVIEMKNLDFCRMIEY